MIFKSSLPARDFPQITLSDLLFENNEKFRPDQPCYIDAEDRSQLMTFGQVKDIAYKFAAGLQRRFPDFKKGDVIAFYAGNNLTYAAAIHSPVIIGGVATTIDASADVESAAVCLSTVAVKIIIASVDTIDNVLKAANIVGVPSSNIFVFGDEDVQGCLSFNKTFLDHNEKAVPASWTPEELATAPCYLCFTSGTTGKKKAVTLTHNSLASALLLKEDWNFDKVNMLTHTDFHHVSALLITIHMNLFHGCTTYILKKYSFEKMLLAIQDCKIHVMATQPWIAAAMAKEPLLDKYDLSSFQLAIVGGSCIDKAVCMTFHERLNAAIVSAYGMTECLNLLESSVVGTLKGELGTLSAGFSAKIIDENGKLLGYNQTGELCVKGPTLTPGYYNIPEFNAQAFDEDGFLHTGDLFQISQDGQVTFIDRIKDIIKYRYHHIPPQDIENVLMLHPLVTDCAAIGIYSEEETSWVPRAFVLLSENSRDHGEIKKEIIDLVKEKLPDHKQLRGGVFVVKKLPRTSTGKVERRTLRLPNIDEWLY
ncbi:phenylacetyl- protein [Mucor ambiguus]|uniref:Phenylacetyl-protein n=1 Tax=Mucor ambiguus TaxID=91626 RepID=A0A0C9LWY8_9FUNG|nr:phenylacetyl- protein [Mucor ambiguus]